jgi:transposase
VHRPLLQINLLTLGRPFRDGHRSSTRKTLTTSNRRRSHRSPRRYDSYRPSNPVSHQAVTTTPYASRANPIPSALAITPRPYSTDQLLLPTQLPQLTQIHLQTLTHIYTNSQRVYEERRNAVYNNVLEKWTEWQKEEGWWGQWMEAQVASIDTCETWLRLLDEDSERRQT